jgi:hypothetical protein
MKNKKLVLIFLLILIIAAGAALNVKVITRQGVNYHVSEIELPLYLKVLNFFDRHLNYKWLVYRVTGDLKTEEEKVFRLFEWIHKTIQPQPKSLPVMDDHVWNVYVRGYGISDNFHDLFTTLCNYTGVDAFFVGVKNEDLSKSIYLSFVRVDKDWVIFDPHRGAYFLNKIGEWATVEEITKLDWRMEKIGQSEITDSYYRSYLENLPTIGERGLGRASIQSPVNRLWFSIQEIFN